MLIVTRVSYWGDYIEAYFYDTNIRKWKKLKNYDYNLYNTEEIADEVIDQLYESGNGEISDFKPEIPKPCIKDFGNIDKLIKKDYDISGYKELRYNLFSSEKEVYKMIILKADSTLIKSEIQNYLRFCHNNVMVMNSILTDNQEVEGFTIPKGTPLSQFEREDIKIKWLIEILKGIYYFKKVGFIHKDIKSDNVIILNDTAKIIDVGGIGETPYWHKSDDPDDIYSFRKLLIELYVENPPKQEDSSKIINESVKFIYDNADDLDKILSYFKNEDN